MGGFLLGGAECSVEVAELRNPRKGSQEVLPLVQGFLCPPPEKGDGLSSSVILVSADGVEGTAWHRHRGGPVKGGQCASVSSLCGGGPAGVQSSSYQRP